MKKASILIPIFLVILVQFSFGQNQNNTVSVLDLSIDPAGYITEINLPPAPMEGNIYIDEEWRYGTITFLGGRQIEGLQLRYDAQHQNLEFIHKADDAKICPLHLLDSYQVLTKKGKSVYKNIAQTSLKSQGLTGVVEVLFNGDVNLYNYTSIEIQEPTYSVEFNTGRRSKKIIKKPNYYFDTNSKAYRVATSLAKNKPIFGSNFHEIETFANKNKLKAKNESDLIRIVAYYDKLLNQ